MFRLVNTSAYCAQLMRPNKSTSQGRKLQCH